MVRTITVDGRNTCKINGVPVNVTVLREVGQGLINIHGQHDNQALLNPESHISFIDLYGGYTDIINDYKDCYNRLKAVRKQLKSLVIDDEEKARRIDFLKFQINEITAANMKQGELEGLVSRRELIRNAERLRENLTLCYSSLSGDDENSGANTLCSNAVSALSSCTQKLENAKPIAERLLAANAELEDITSEVRQLLGEISFDPSELEECEQRIDIINSLIKKYGGSEGAVISYLETAQKELDGIYRSEELLIETERQSSELEDELIAKGNALTTARKKNAEIFSSRVCDVLKYLEMPNVVFYVNFNQCMYTVNGCDDVEFYISANSGQAVKPLAKVASGGELSRIMLSIKSVMNSIADADTLIFDEIDTGISGKAADKVGRQLKTLSEDRQVICVTHLAQIAAAAKTHLLISKSISDGNTYTKVENICNDDRILEIARIMSGGDMTENLYKSAKELIDNHF